MLAGLAVMIVLIPLNGSAATKAKSYQILQMKYKDERIKIMNEVLSGIKVTTYTFVRLLLLFRNEKYVTFLARFCHFILRRQQVSITINF